VASLSRSAETGATRAGQLVAAQPDHMGHPPTAEAAPGTYNYIQFLEADMHPAMDLHEQATAQP
jgi:hypothetical protein